MIVHLNWSIVNVFALPISIKQQDSKALVNTSIVEVV